MLDRELHVGEEECEPLREGAHGAGVDGAGPRGTGVEGIRRATAADGDAVVGGALGVDEGVGGVAQAFALLPADALPRLRGQLIGHDHRGVDGNHVPPAEPGDIALDLAGVRLHAGQHGLGAHGPTRGGDGARRDARGPRVLTDPDPLGLDDRREAVDQLGGVDAGGGTGEEAAERGPDGDAPPDGVGVKEFEVLSPVSGGEIRGVSSFKPLQSSRSCGHPQMPAAPLVGLDALLVEDAQRVIDSAIHLPLERGDRGSTVLPTPPRALGVHGTVAGDERGEPAAVAPGGPVADLLGLDHGDLRRRPLKDRVVGRPEPGQATADDHEVLLLVGQRGVPARGRARELVRGGAGRLYPMRYLTVAVHGHATTPAGRKGIGASGTR